MFKKALNREIAFGKNVEEILKNLEKMDKYLAGLVTLEKSPDAVFIPSMQMEKTTVTEANKMKIPVIGVCDTNANPNKADYVIPANDDAVKSIEMIVGLVTEAIKEGLAERAKNAAAVKTEGVAPVKTAEKASK